jgi:hypothetical protein
MKGIKNINKKLLITIFTALFLIGFIYSIYSQATSAQNNAVNSLESNSIVQWIITSSANGYSTVAKYLANFLSIKGVPAYVWTIITFLMATLFFIAIYSYLFEIFIQRTGISESETMRKAKILFIFTLSVFSAIAIGFAIPFLFNLYGFILLIFLLIALFFFGRATVSYGKSFHHAAKSFATNVERDLVEAERELKEARKNLSEQDVRYLEEGIEKVNSIYNEVRKDFNNAETKFQNILSHLELAYKVFISLFINESERYLNQQNLSRNQRNEKDKFIRDLAEKRDRMNRQKILNTKKSPKDLYNEILSVIGSLSYLKSYEQELKKRLHGVYIYTFHSPQSPHHRIFRDIQDTINEYEKVRNSLMRFYGFENGFKRDINVRFRYFLSAPDSRKYEIGILSTLDKSKNSMERIENLINERIQFLKHLL